MAVRGDDQDYCSTCPRQLSLLTRACAFLHVLLRDVVQGPFAGSLTAKAVGQDYLITVEGKELVFTPTTGLPAPSSTGFSAFVSGSTLNVSLFCLISLFCLLCLICLICLLCLPCSFLFLMVFRSLPLSFFFFPSLPLSLFSSLSLLFCYLVSPCFAAHLLKKV